MFLNVFLYWSKPLNRIVTGYFSWGMSKQSEQNAAQEHYIKKNGPLFRLYSHHQTRVNNAVHSSRTTTFAYYIPHTSGTFLSLWHHLSSRMWDAILFQLQCDRLKRHRLELNITMFLSLAFPENQVRSWSSGACFSSQTRLRRSWILSSLLNTEIVAHRSTTLRRDALSVPPHSVWMI